MKTSAVALCALPLIASSLSGCRTAAAQNRPATSRRIQLTVYKDDFAMVREVRGASMQAGRNRLRISDVSNSLDPQSVLLGFSTEGAKVVSNTYDLGVGAADSMVSRLAGKNVEVMFPSEDGSPGKTISGILEPSADGGYLLRAEDKLYLNPPGTIIAPADSNVATMPQLWAEVEAKGSAASDMKLAYLTRGLSWSADYVAKIEGDQMKFELWSTVTNKTGLSFPDADITFMAGSPNRAVVAENRRYEFQAAKRARASGGMDMGVMPTMLAAPAGELYAYKAPARATIGVDQMNRVPMMEPTTVPIKRDYSVALPNLFAYGYDSYGSSRISAQLAISFDNSKKAGLGIPLPAGAVRVYGAEEYIGAAGLSDTPEDTPIHLTLSKVFDVSAEPKVSASRKLDKRTVLKTLSIALANEKDSAVTLRLVQPIYGRFKVRSESAKSQKLNAETLQWKVELPAHTKQTIKAEIELRS